MARSGNGTKEERHQRLLVWWEQSEEVNKIAKNDVVRRNVVLRNKKFPNRTAFHHIAVAVEQMHIGDGRCWCPVGRSALKKYCAKGRVGWNGAIRCKPYDNPSVAVEQMLDLPPLPPSFDQLEKSKKKMKDFVESLASAKKDSSNSMTGKEHLDLLITSRDIDPDNPDEDRDPTKMLLSEKVYWYIRNSAYDGTVFCIHKLKAIASFDHVTPHEVQKRIYISNVEAEVKKMCLMYDSYANDYTNKKDAQEQPEELKKSMVVPLSALTTAIKEEIFEDARVNSFVVKASENVVKVVRTTAELQFEAQVCA